MGSLHQLFFHGTLLVLPAQHLEETFPFPRTVTNLRKSFCNVTLPDPGTLRVHSVLDSLCLRISELEESIQLSWYNQEAHKLRVKLIEMFTTPELGSFPYPKYNTQGHYKNSPLISIVVGALHLYYKCAILHSSLMHPKWKRSPRWA